MTRRFGLALALLLVALGAGLAAIAAGSTWFTAGFPNTPMGYFQTSARGTDTVPELVPVALVALAGIGAVLATKGVWRRVIGGLVAAAGALIAVRSVLALISPPLDLLGRTPFPHETAVHAISHPTTPVLAVAGGLVLAAGGLLLALGWGASRSLGARYSAPGTAASAAQSSTESDLWRALDRGTDPTEQDGPDRPLGAAGTGQPGQ